jgi:TP901 family phage tail tape measure protein
MTVEQIKAEVTADVSGLKAGLGQAKAAVTDFAKTIKSEGDRMNASAAEFMKSLDKEAAATKVLTEAKRQQITFDRELRAAKAQLTVVLNEESTAAERVARQYNLLGASVRQQLVRVEEQITAQKALQQAELATAAAAEKAAAAQVAASQKAAAATEAASAKQLAAARKNLGRNLERTGGALTSGLTVPILAGAGAAVASGADLQNAEAQIRAATGASGERLKALDAVLKQVADSVPQTFSQVGEAVSGLAVRTGLTGDSLAKLATQELNLSRLTRSDVGETVQRTTQIFEAWGIATTDQADALDQLYRAGQAAGGKVLELSANLAKFAPALKTLGFSFTDAAALLASFEKAGLPPQRMLTGLQTALQKLAKVGVTDAHQALQLIIQQLKNAHSPMEALTTAGQLFGRTVGTQVVTAIREGRFNLEALEKTIVSGKDTINGAARDTNTFGVAWGKFRNQVELALAPLGEMILNAGSKLLEALKPSLVKLKDLIEAFTKLPSGAQLAIVGVIGFLAVIGPAIVSIGRLVTAIREIKIAWLEFSLLARGQAGFAAITAGLEALGLGAVAAAAPWVAAFVLMAGAVYELLNALDKTDYTAAKFGQKNPFAREHPFKGPLPAGSASTSGGGGTLTEEPLFAGPASDRAAASDPAKQRLADLLKRIHDAEQGTKKAKQTEEEKDSKRATELIAKNSRIRAFLAAGESVEVAKLSAEYGHLSKSQLEAVVSSNKVTEAAIKTAESHKEYTKDIHKLEAEIHRLKLGHDAEASGVDALREKYPGLSTAMLAAMNNAIQWRKHLVELRQEAHRVEEAIRGIQVTVLEAGAGNRVDEAAARLFGPALLEKGKRPKSAGDLFKNYLTPEQQIEAQTEAGTSAFASIDQQLAAARQNLFQNYGTLGDKKTVGLKDRAGQIFSAAVGQNPGSYLSDEQRKQLMAKAEALVKVKDAADQATAAISVYNGEFDKINTVSGQAQVNLDLLHRHFDAMTGSNQLAKDVMERFGVVLSTLPPKIQAIIKEFIKLDKAQQAYQDFADGVTSVFNTAFLNLTHGFKSFYQSIVQGFEQMLQEMAAKYLASQLANAFLNLLGSAFGGKEAFAQILGSISGKASGGSSPRTPLTSSASAGRSCSPPPAVAGLRRTASWRERAAGGRSTSP